MPSTDFAALVIEAQLRYGPELVALAELGFDPQIRVCGRVNIGIPLGEVRGVALEMLVCNGDAGLVLDDENGPGTEWCAEIYTHHDGTPLDIFCFGYTAVSAVQTAAALLADPVRVAVLSPEGRWQFTMLPAAALGDPDAEADLLAPQSTDWQIPANVVVLDENVPGWPRGCSTHSRCYPIERAAAVATHRDCGHELLADWTDHGLVGDWWATLSDARRA